MIIPYLHYFLLCNQILFRKEPLSENVNKLVVLECQMVNHQGLISRKHSCLKRIKDKLANIFLNNFQSPGGLNFWKT